MQLLTLEAWMFSNRQKDKVNYEDTGIDTDIIIDHSKGYELISDPLSGQNWLSFFRRLLSIS